jgi:hypothetical protein
MTMKRSISKRVSELSAWDLDAGCRNIVNQASPTNRRLKKKIRRQDRKRLDKYSERVYNDDVERS